MLLSVPVVADLNMLMHAVADDATPITKVSLPLRGIGGRLQRTCEVCCLLCSEPLVIRLLLVCLLVEINMIFQLKKLLNCICNSNTLRYCSGYWKRSDVTNFWKYNFFLRLFKKSMKVCVSLHCEVLEKS